MTAPTHSGRSPETVGQIIADDWERYALAVQAESALAKRRFLVDWPALTRWRDRVLADRRSYAPDVVAAALEALALECYLSGEPELAERAVEQAQSTVLAHARRIAPAARRQPDAGAHMDAHD